MRDASLDSHLCVTLLVPFVRLRYTLPDPWICIYIPTSPKPEFESVTAASSRAPRLQALNNLITVGEWYRICSLFRRQCSSAPERLPEVFLRVPCTPPNPLFILNPPLLWKTPFLFFFLTLFSYFILLIFLSLLPFLSPPFMSAVSFALLLRLCLFSQTSTFFSSSYL